VVRLLKRVGLIAFLLIVVLLFLVILRVTRVLLFPPPGLAAVSIGISEALVEALVLVASAVAVWRVWRLMRRRSRASEDSS
jgi:hypothetical protein